MTIQAVHHFPLFDALPPVFLSWTQVGWSVWGSLLLLFFFLPSHLLLIFDTVSLYSWGWSLSHSLSSSESIGMSHSIKFLDTFQLKPRQIWWLILAGHPSTGEEEVKVQGLPGLLRSCLKKKWSSKRATLLKTFLKRVAGKSSTINVTWSALE